MPHIGYKQTREHKKKYKRSGKDNPFFGKKHTKVTKKLISTNHADFSGDKNPRFDVILSKSTKKKISKNHADFSGKKNPMHGKKLIKHHLYLRSNPYTIRISAAKHRQFHARAYDYLLATGGPKSADRYLKWFDKKFGITIHK